MKKILFIINPIAGVSRKTELPRLISERIDSRRFEVHTAFTKYAGHAKSITRQAVSQGFDAVVAVGGDGSMNEVASNLVDTDIAMGIIPSGSGNGLALSLSIPGSPEAAIDLINRHNTAYIDAGSINDRLFFSNSGLGFEAEVVDTFAKTKMRGFLEYARVIAHHYFNYQSRDYLIHTDSGTIREKAFMVHFSNSGQYGYNMGIRPPKSQINDGKVELFLVKDFERWRVVYLVPLFMLGRAYWSKYISYRKVRRASISVQPHDKVQVDGDPHPTSPGHMEVNVLKKRLKVIVP